MQPKVSSLVLLWSFSKRTMCLKSNPDAMHGRVNNFEAFWQSNNVLNPRILYVQNPATV